MTICRTTKSDAAGLEAPNQAPSASGGMADCLHDGEAQQAAVELGRAHPNLSLSAFATLIAIGDATLPTTGTCAMSRKELASRAHCSLPTVDKAIKELVEAKLISKTRGQDPLWRTPICILKLAMEKLHIQHQEISGKVKDLADFLDFVPVDCIYCLTCDDLETAAQSEILASFHATEVFMHKEDDDYFAGIRANHFVIEVGFSEASPQEEGWVTVVCTGNHKGRRAVTVAQFKHPLSDSQNA